MRKELLLDNQSKNSGKTRGPLNHFLIVSNLSIHTHICLQLGKGGLLPHTGGGLNNINGLNGLNGFGPGVLSPAGDAVNCNNLNKSV